MFTNIKTTVTGFVLIGLGILGLKWGNLDNIAGTAIITAGLGLVAAKDSNVTGGTKEQ